MKSNWNISVFCFLLFLLCNCKKEEVSSQFNQEFLESKVNDSLFDENGAEEAKTIRYTAFIFPKNKYERDSVMQLFNQRFSQDEQYTILALNRLDFKNRWRADTLVIPESLDENFLTYAPFPKVVETLKPIHKIALFSYAIHAYALYEYGNLVKWGPSSMGKKTTPTHRGLMFTNWKKKMAISTSNPNWKLPWNFNVHNTKGIAWHQYDLPGFHASHSCMRLLEEDARWMYSWADQWVLDEKGQNIKAKGTPVIVFGVSDFKTQPWKKLLDNPKATDIPEDTIQSLIYPYLNDILNEQKKRRKFEFSNSKA